jgi:hypothetical protein
MTLIAAVLLLAAYQSAPVFQAPNAGEPMTAAPEAIIRIRYRRDSDCWIGRHGSFRAPGLSRGPVSGWGSCLSGIVEP